MAGSTSHVGRRLVARLRAGGHAVVALDRAAGIEVLTGTGLGAALVGIDVVIDVLQPPDREPEPALAFLQVSTLRLLAAEQSTGVRHHVLLSVVGADRATGDGRHVARVVQQDTLQDGEVPFSVVRATQLHEDLLDLADELTVDGVVLAPRTRLRPVAAQDVVDLLTATACGAPTGTAADLAGPDELSLDALLRRVLVTAGDPRPVRTVSGHALGAWSADALLPLGTHHRGTRRLPPAS